ncbi:MAG: hypothetical protein Q4D88_02150 [Anaerococcus sp.]|nr:hypothetical protein [Anaerococcus sp.]
MAVEKMYLVNMTSRLENLNDFLEDLIKLGDIEVVDAFNQVASRSFSIKASKENVELTEDFSTISNFERKNDQVIDKLRTIKDLFKIGDENIKEKYISSENVDKLYGDLNTLIKKKEELLEEKKRLEEYKENLELLETYGIDIKKINRLNFFEYRFGEVSKDGRFILKNNYDNLPSLILHLDKSTDDMSLSYLDELISLDQETSKLREDTDRLVEAERENTLNLISDFEKRYAKKNKEESDRLYNSILNQAEIKGSKIDKAYNEKKLQLDNKYSKFSQEIVDEVFDLILKEGDR